MILAKQIIFTVGASLLLAVAVSFFIPSSTLAHSGRTDASGGHNCNVGSCAGTYHYHNGGGSSTPSTPNYTQLGTTNGKAHADNEAANIKAMSTSNAYQTGYQDANNNKSINYYAVIPTSICDTNFTFDAGTSEAYKLAYDLGWETQCRAIANTVYQTSYNNGYAEGSKAQVAAATTNEPSSSNDTSGGSTGWGWLAAVGIFYGGMYGIGRVAEGVKKSKNKNSF
jgi:hypothetical protein